MSKMEQHFIKVNGQEIHVRVWNSEQRETVFCSHGFTRTSADFLVLADYLAQAGYRVIAPDTLGRGLSQWSHEPPREYNLANYANIMIGIIRHFSCAKLHWVGCDMGGLIGILLASDSKYKRLFRSLSLNDIGPEIPKNMVETIVKKAGNKHCFTQFQDALAYLDKEYFPKCTDEKIWQSVCESSIRRLSVGGFTLHYDNNIFLSTHGSTIKLWNRFRHLDLPLMVIYGVNSKVLTPSILNKMREIQPKLIVNYLVDCHHPPSLLTASCCEHILNFVESRKNQSYIQKTG